MGTHDDLLKRAVKVSHTRRAELAVRILGSLDRRHEVAETSSDDLTATVLGLPEHERSDLARAILESLDDPPDKDDYDVFWAREIERRCDAIDAGKATTTEWDVLRKRIELEILGR